MYALKKISFIPPNTFVPLSGSPHQPTSSLSLRSPQKEFICSYTPTGKEPYHSTIPTYRGSRVLLKARIACLFQESAAKLKGHTTGLAAARYPSDDKVFQRLRWSPFRLDIPPLET